MVNTGFIQDRLLIDKMRKEETVERQSNMEAPVVAHGHAAEAFKSQPFWKIVERDLTKLEQKLLEQLTDTSKSLSKYVMDELRRDINNIRMFRDLPNKYIARLKDIQKRRGKGR